jgi:pSer/pThr/pTyr-binding forkhead associated (FHA) protein
MENKISNSELSIKCTIWERETFELIDYYSKETIDTRFKVNSSGVISRNNKQISFIPGESNPEASSDLIRIRKNESDGRFIIDCGEWSKDLAQLVDEQGAFMVYRGISIKQLNNNLNNRYYKLSQGDIIKIGRIYFKVLDIHLKSYNADIKSNVDSTIRGTIIRSSSCNSIVVNGQEIIKGAFSPNQNKKDAVDLCLSGNANLNQNNNSLFVIEKTNKKENESANKIISKVGSTKELFSMTKKNNKKTKDKVEKNNKNEKKVDEKNEMDGNNQKNKSNRICRICYGDDTTSENPLICPCICKGSMKYIHYECLKNWLNSKIEEDISVDSENPEVEVISYNRKDISCELCKEKLPDYVKHNDRYYNISFYKPKFEEFVVLESMRADKHKAKFIHIISYDKKSSINIGRANECELSISELSVSRFHCIIHKDEGELFLEDNSSKFGTLVLIQNNNMYMNDYVPLKVQTNKTYIKFKIVKPFKISCCRDPYIFESKKYDYQIQNRKCFDILSYFIIKEDDPNQTEKEEEEENKNNINEKENDLIDDDDKNENEGKKEDNNVNNINKELINDDTKKENKSEIDYEHLDSKTHSHRIKKVNIKKGKNDASELPNLNKINIEHFRDSISLIADKDGKQPGANNNNNGQQNKQISLIKLSKKEGNYDKTNANPSIGGNSTIPVNSLGVVNDYSNKHK